MEIKAIVKPEKLEDTTDELQKLHVNLDDSSDEEDTNERTVNYSFEKSWSNYIQSQQYNELSFLTNRNHISIQFSFMAHALGIQALHQKSISRTYYDLKQKLLKSTEPTKEQLKQYVSKSIQDTIIELIELSCKSFLVAKDQTNQIIPISEQMKLEIRKNVLEELREIIDITTRELILERTLLQQVEQQTLKPNINKCLNNLKLEFEKCFVAHAQKYQLLCRGALPQACVEDARYNAAFLPFASSKEVLTLVLNQLAHAQAIDNQNPNPSNWMVYNKNKNKKNQIAWEAQVEENILQLPCIELIQLAWRTIKNRQGGSCAIKHLEALAPTTLEKVYIRDLMRLDSAENAESSTSDIWQFVQRFPSLKPFFALSHERFLSELRISFDTLFLTSLSKNRAEFRLKQLARPTLPNNYLFFSTNSTDHLAYQRLKYRSQQRLIKNLSENPLVQALGEKELEEDEEKGKQYIQKVHRSYQFFNQSQAEESLGILASFGRDDYIDNAGSYQNVHKKINRLIKYLNGQYAINPPITDRDIALWMRQTINGKSLSRLETLNLPKEEEKILINLIANFSYLFLSCEADRNPAMYIINQMLLDLVIYANMSWQYILNDNSGEFNDGGLMPMSPDKVVAPARRLQSIFYHYMPYDYEYSGRTTSSANQIKDLVEREAKVMHKWLCWKYDYDINSDINKIWSDTSMIAMVNIIQSEMNRWLITMEEPQKVVTLTMDNKTIKLQKS